MIIAILILFSIIVISSLPIGIHILSRDDTIKIYFTLFNHDILIPHQRFIKYESKKISKIRNNWHKNNIFIKNVISYSVVDVFYVAKCTKNQELYGIADGLFIIMANYLYSILNCRARGIKDSIIRLEESRYKGIDYYLKAHTSIFQIIWAFIITIFMR